MTPAVLPVEFAAGTRDARVSVPEYLSTGVLVSTQPSVSLPTGPNALLQSGLVR